MASSGTPSINDSSVDKPNCVAKLGADIKLISSLLGLDPFNNPTKTEALIKFPIFAGVSPLIRTLKLVPCGESPIASLPSDSPNCDHDLLAGFSISDNRGAFT